MRWREWVDAVGEGFGHVQLRVRSVLDDEDDSPSRDEDHTEDDPGPDAPEGPRLVPWEEESS